MKEEEKKRKNPRNKIKLKSKNEMYSQQSILSQTKHLHIIKGSLPTSLQSAALLLLIKR